MKTSLATLSLVLAACGGGGGETPQPAPQQPAPVVVKTYIIDYYGDSTIWGLNVDGSHTQYKGNPPAVLQTELTRRCGFQVTVNNLAVPGTYASQLLYGTAEYQNTPFPARMTASKAQLVIPGGFGLNDSVGYADVPSFKFQVSELVRIAREAGKTVVLETSNPTGTGYGFALSKNIDLYVNAMKQVGTEAGVLVVDQYTPFFPATPTTFPDGIHPTETVSIQKAMRMADALQPLVCK